jgi:hypothetical protein
LYEFSRLFIIFLPFLFWHSPHCTFQLSTCGVSFLIVIVPVVACSNRYCHLYLPSAWLS